METQNHTLSPILKALNIKSTQLEIAGNKVVTLFDDIQFTQCDFDIVDGKTRNLITSALKKKDYSIKGSRLFISPEGESYQFAKPSHTLGCNPADKVNEVLSSDKTTFCTPTQTLLLLALHQSPLLDDESFLKEFLLNQPANIKKVLQWINHDNLKKIPFSEATLNEWNELGAKKKRGF